MSKRWSKEEEEYFCEAWGMQPVQKIINYMKTKFKREVKAKTLESKAYRLGLESATLNSNWLNTTHIAEALGISRTTVIKWFRTGTIKKPKYVLVKRGMYLINLEDLMKWLKSNQELWDSRKVEYYALGEEPKWLKEKRKKDLQGYKPPKCKKVFKQKRYIIDQKTILELRKRKEEGETYTKLSKDYHISRSAIHRYVKKYNISA